MICIITTPLDDHYCSNISIRCSLYGTTQELYRTHSYMPSGITIVLIVTSIVAFLICVVCCTVLYKQQQRHVRSTIVASHRSSAIHPYQQDPSDIVHIRPAYNINRAPISLPIPSQHEEQPPSYEFATANDPFKYQYESSSLPVSSVTTNIALESTRF